MRIEIEVKNEREGFAVRRFATILRQAEITNRDGDVTVRLHFHQGGIRNSSLLWEEPGYFCNPKKL